jgi:hypothetical protein
MAKPIKKKPPPTKPKLKQSCTPVCEVNNPDKSPFQVSVTFSEGAGQPVMDGTVIAVPTGKRLVMEYISGQVFVPNGQKLLFSVFCRGQDEGAFHYLVSTPVAPFGSENCFQCGQVVRLYSDPGTGVVLRIERSPSEGTVFGHMSISGHFVSVP